MLRAEQTGGSSQRNKTSIADSSDIMAAARDFIICSKDANFQTDDVVDVTSKLELLQALERAVNKTKLLLVDRVQALSDDNIIDSPNIFLASTGGVSVRQASKQVEVASAVNRLDKVGIKIDPSEVPIEKLESIARHTAKLDDDQLTQLNMKDPTTNRTRPQISVENFDKDLRNKSERLRNNRLQDYESRRLASEFKHWFNRKTQMGHVNGKFDGITYEKIATLLDREATRLANQKKRPLGITSNAKKDPHLAAKALVKLLETPKSYESKSDTSNARSRRAPEAEIVVVCDKKTLKVGIHKESVCETSSGAEIPIETLDRLACDSLYRKVVLDESSQPINVGRRYRTGTKAQWAAAIATHSSCAWDQCQTRISWCQLHHVKFWNNGGKTDFDNLVPLCSKHHGKVHEQKWEIHKTKDGLLEILRPDRSVYKRYSSPSRDPGGG